ncbi:MAG: rhomboid family intramembrane serine protease [Actinomycetota bacterium]
MSEQPCAFHPHRMTGVSCSRCDRPICPDDMHPAPVGIHCPVCAGQMREGPLGEAQYRARMRAQRHPLLRQLSGSQMTTVLLAANVVVFVLMVATGAPTSGRTLYRFGALISPLPSSQWWRLITAMFVHIGIGHILFNMFALVLFGGAIEQRHGKMRFLCLYLASGVAGNAVALAYSHASLSAGASGAIFGILGAWLALVVVNHRAAASQLRGWVLLIGFNLFYSIVTPGIDLHAHIGGLLGGFVIAVGLELGARAKGGARAAISTGGYVIVAIAAYVLTSAHVL